MNKETIHIENLSIGYPGKGDVKVVADGICAGINSGDGIEQRRFPGAVGTHDDMRFARIDRQIEALEDFFAFDGDMQAFYS